MQTDLYAFDCAQLSEGVLVGVDEAGRGPLAGPVVAAACILPANLKLPALNDSKKLTPRQRFELFTALTSHPSIQFATSILDAEQIDRLNILQATLHAMVAAIQQLPRPDLVLIDGNQLPDLPFPARALVKGDGRSACIAAASIIAKVTRDQIMEEFDLQWPHYGFARHKGYGTQFHRRMIDLHGPCPIHRHSFEPIKSLVKYAAQA